MLTVYSSNTTSFSNLGIGALKDFISNPLITEELNGAYTLEFSYAKDGYLSEYLVEQNIIKANGQPFRIWNVKKDMKSITILAKHIFFDLSFNFLADVYPKNLTSQGALAWLISHAQTPTNFTVSGNCTVVSNARYVRKNIVDAIYNEDNALLERFGGELSFDNFAITVNETRGTNANFSIRYKKNLIGIDFNLDFSNVATRIIPIGFDGITIDSLYVESPKVGNYFTPLYKTYEFSNIKYDPDDEEAYHTLEEAKQALTSAANDLFNKDVDIPQISVKVNFVELSKCTEYESYSNLETVHLGDTIDVIVPELNIKTKARVVKTVYDCILKRFTTLEIGNVTPSATTNQIEVNNQVKKTENYINEAQKNAENLINHPFKGNLYIDSTPGSGVIYFMDTTNPATAQSIWKWSIGGLGYSPNGINGTYTIGITQDGKINADFITTGHLNTSVIEGYDSLVVQVNQNTNNLIPTDSLESSDNTYHFEDSAESNLVNFAIDGKSTQETRSGKNKIGILDKAQQTYNGITYKSENGTITLSGTTTTTVIIDFNIKEDILSSFGTLTKSLNLSGTYANIQTSLRDSSTNLAGLWSNNAANVTGTLTSNAHLLRIQINSGISVNCTLKPQVELGTTATEYEPYGVMPSPDYPSEIESVGYENLFDGEIELGNISPNTGELISSTSRTRSKNFIKVEPNTEYVYRFQPHQYRWIIGYTEQKVGITDGNYENHPSAIKKFIPIGEYYVGYFKTSPTTQYIKWYDTNSTDLDETIQLENGNIAHTHIPYGKYGIEYKTVGKNLLDTSIIKTVKNQSGSDRDGYYCRILKTGTYYLQLNTANTMYFAKSSNLTQASTLIGSTSSSYSTTYNFNAGEYFVIWGTKTNTDKLMVTLNTTTTPPYEPYQEQTQLIQLDEPLRSIGNVKDKLRIENNTLYVDRYIGRAVLNGSESWVLYNATGTQPRRLGIQNTMWYKNSISLKSNYFIGGNYNSQIDLSIWTQTNYLAITDKNNKWGTANDFKTWLSTHPTEVIYQLAEPNTEVVGEMKLPTLLNTNNIDIYSNILTDSSLTYTRNVDLANYINNQIVSSEASIKVTTDSIQSQVSSNAEGLNSAVTTLTEQGLDIDILHTNIDGEGNVTEVTTSNKHFSLNNDGLTITGNEGFKAIQNEYGAYYYNGNDVVGQYTKDGSLQKDLYLFGSYRYGMDDIDDTPMFVGQKYTKVVNGTARQVFGHFLNK